MVVVIPGALEDSKNISEKEYYKKWGQSKTDHVYGDPISFTAEKEPTKDISQGFWGTLFSSVSSSSIVSFIRYQLALGGPRDTSFSINEENIRGYEDHIGFLLQANSETELNNIKKTIDEVRLNQQVVASANGFLGTSGGIIGGFIDPTVLLSGGIAGAGIKTIAATAKGINWAKKASVFAKNVIEDKFGKDFAASAGGVMLKSFGSGVLGGATTGAIDVGIESLVEDVDSEDALSKIAWFSIFGGGLGLLVGANKGTQMSLQRKRADKLVNAINTKNPNKIVLTDAEFQKAVNNPDFINAKIKSALGMENLQTSPDIRGNLSPSNVVKSVMNTLVDNPFVLINESSGKIIVVSPSVESVASSMVAESLFKLQKNINNYYSKWLQEKYGNALIAKLKSFKDLKVWAGGKDYEAFLQELSNESFTPGSTSSSVIRELANKNYNEIIKPLADYGMKHDLWGYKKTKDFELNQKKTELEKGIKSNDREIARIISQRKISVPIGKVNGLMKNQDVTIEAVEKHLKGLEKSLGQNQKRQALLESINEKISPDIKDSKALRKLTQQLKNARSSFEKETKENIKQYFSEKIKADTKFETLEEAIDAEEKVVADLIENINLKSDVAIKPSELKELGKINEKIRVVENKIKSSSRKQPRQEKLLKTLKMHKSFLEFLSKNSKGTTPAEWKKLGKEQKVLKDLIKERDSVFKNREKLFKKGEKKQTTIEDKLIDALEKLIPEIDKLKNNPNAKLTEGQLRELKGKVKEQLKNLAKEERTLIKDKELKSKAIEDARAERSEEVDKLSADTEAKAKEIEETDKAIEENNKKVYTQEDFERLPEGERYFPRRFDTIKVGINEKGAINAIKKGFWSESKYRDLKNIPEKELTAEQKKVLLEEDNRLSEAAQDVVNKILHREDKGVVKNTRKTRGPERPRNLTFSTKYIEDYMIQDPMNALRDYIRTVITDTELLKRFGTLNLNEITNAIENDYEGLIKNSVSEKQKKTLNTRKEKDLEDIRCVWCRVRGIKEYSAEDLTEWGRAFNHGANIINNLNVARLIGGTVISATSDLAQACMTVGFKNFFKGVSKWFNKDFREAFRGEEDTWLRAIDHFKNTRQLGFYNQMIDSGVLAAVDNFSGKLADLSVKMSMITKWDELNKFIIGYVAQERVLKIGEKLIKKSKLSIKDSEWLTTTGITEENATKMFEQFKKYGRITDGGIWESSVGYWDNNKLKDIFRGAVKKIQNQAILTPTAGSVPRGFDVSFLKPILQFKRFTFSAYSKCMIPTLQKRDLNAFAGITMMMSIGIMKAYLRALKSGYAISMTDAVKTSLKEAEVGSYFGDAYGLLSNFVGLNDKKNQTSQQFMRDMFGTGYDFITTFHDGSLGLSKLITGLGGEMSYGQIHNIRKMLPLQNNIFLSKLFDAFEASEIDKRGTKRAKKIFSEKKNQ